MCVIFKYVTHLTIMKMAYDLHKYVFCFTNQELIIIKVKTLTFDKKKNILLDCIIVSLILCFVICVTI